MVSTFSLLALGTWAVGFLYTSCSWYCWARRESLCRARSGFSGPLNPYWAPSRAESVLSDFSTAITSSLAWVLKRRWRFSYRATACRMWSDHPYLKLSLQNTEQKQQVIAGQVLSCPAGLPPLSLVSHVGWVVFLRMTSIPRRHLRSNWRIRNDWRRQLNMRTSRTTLPIKEKVKRGHALCLSSTSGHCVASFMG